MAQSEGGILLPAKGGFSIQVAQLSSRETDHYLENLKKGVAKMGDSPA